MNEKKLKKQLINEMKSVTPNVFDKVLKNINPQKVYSEKRTTFFQKLKSIFQTKAFVAASLCFLFLIASVSTLTIFLANNNNVYATIALDVNPSIEIQVDADNQILSVSANNDDAVLVLDELDLKDKSLDEAMDLIMSSMIENGYLTETKNSVLLSIQGKNNQDEIKIKNNLVQKINQVLSQENITSAIMVQYFKHNDIIKDLAESLGISVGKANLIQRVIEIDSTLSANDLAELSISDINLLIHSKNLYLEDIELDGEANGDRYVSKQDAIDAVLTELSLSIGDISELEIEFDIDDKKIIYEIEFETTTLKYIYKINATDGTIIESKSQELTHGGEGETAPHNAISEDDAAAIAFSHIGHTKQEAEEIQVKYRFDNPAHIYQITFKIADEEYSFKINAISGAIISYDVE